MNPSFENTFSPLTGADWNFDAVPDGEIIACCLWEYARESRSIGMAAEMHWCHVRGIGNGERYKLEPELKAAHDEEAIRIERHVKANGFDYEAFITKFWDSDLALIEIYQSLKEHVINNARAWQQIPEKARMQLNGEVSQSFLLCPMTQAMVGELEKLWDASRKDLDEIRAETRPVYDDSEGWALHQPSEPVTLEVEAGKPAAGSKVVALTVDFARFTDREILDEFQKWLAANRPQQWRKPLRVFPSSSARGKKQIEYRVALERLGLMRLLHWHPPGELSDLWPEAWEKYRRKRDSFRREVRAASRFFRKLFPFLPPGEKPSSEERHAIWMKEMDKIMEEVDREF